STPTPPRTSSLTSARTTRPSKRPPILPISMNFSPAQRTTNNAQLTPQQIHRRPTHRHHPDSNRLPLRQILRRMQTRQRPSSRPLTFLNRLALHRTQPIHADRNLRLLPSILPKILSPHGRLALHHILLPHHHLQRLHH